MAKSLVGINAWDYWLCGRNSYVNKCYKRQKCVVVDFPTPLHIKCNDQVQIPVENHIEYDVLKILNRQIVHIAFY